MKQIILIIIILLSPEIVSGSWLWDNKECGFLKIIETAYSGNTDYCSTLTVTDAGPAISITGCQYVSGGNGYYVEIKAYAYYSGDWTNTTSFGAIAKSDYELVTEIPNGGNLPSSCPVRCEDEYTDKQAECENKGELWDENSTNEENCESECLACSGEGEKTETEMNAECDGLGGILFYSSETCSGSCRGVCTDSDLVEAEADCGELGLDRATWSNVICDGYCNGCMPEHVQQALTDCAQSGATLDESSYECTATPEKGIELDYKCEGVNSTIPPEDPEDPTPDPEDPDPVPEPEPDGEPSPDPTNDDPSTNDNIESEYLKGIKDNTDTLIDNTNNTNSLLNGIAGNIEKSVKNQAILNKNIKKLDNSGTEKILKKLYRELIGVQKKVGDVEDGIDELKDGYTVGDDTATEFIEDGTLLGGELTTLGQNFQTLKTEITQAVGVDLNGFSGLPSWTLPTPFGDFDIDLNDYQFVFNAIGNVVLFAAYLSGAIIIFG